MKERHNRKLKTSTVDLCYRTIGKSTDNLILVHGLAANMGFWDPLLVIELSRRFRVTLFDLRGHGYSSMPPSGYHATNMRDDLLALMDHLGIEQAHLAGHSFGGTVALHCALKSPQRVTSLALLDSRLKALQPHQRLIDWPNWQQVKKNLEGIGLEIDEHQENVGLVLLEKFAGQDWKEMREKLSGQAMFVPFGGRYAGERLAKQWLQLLDQTTARDDFNQPDELTPRKLALLKKPILGYYGANSRCMTTCNNLREVWPDCAIRIMPDAGHFFPAVHPRAVTDTLSNFLVSQGYPRVRNADTAVASEPSVKTENRSALILEEEAPA